MPAENRVSECPSLNWEEFFVDQFVALLNASHVFGFSPLQGITSLNWWILFVLGCKLSAGCHTTKIIRRRKPLPAAITSNDIEWRL
ncbi:hypothetical protein PGB90_007721 [Kerria lacca]